MKYKLQPGIQIASAVVSAVVVAGIGYLFYGEIDWLTVGGVAVGVGIGMGFTRKI